MRVLLSTLNNTNTATSMFNVDFLIAFAIRISKKVNRKFEMCRYLCRLRNMLAWPGQRNSYMERSG